MGERFPARVWLSAAAVSLLLVAVLAPSTGAAPGGGPPLVTGSKPGPVAIAGGRGTPNTLIGKLVVGPGKWVAWAKLQVETDQPHSTTNKTLVSCRLVSGTKSSEISATLGFAGAADFIRHGMELSLARVLRDGGQFRLYCRTQNGDPGAIARYIRLDAVRVDRLDRVDLDDGTTTTVGSGDTLAIAAEANNAIDLAHVHHPPTTVADFDIPAGNWWVRAQLPLHGVALDVHCSASLAGRVDKARIHILGALSVVLDLTAHVGRSNPQSLKIECASDAQQGAEAATIDQVRVTAFRVDRLVDHNLGSGSTQSYGAGVPEIRAAFDGDAAVEHTSGTWSTIASEGLDAGDWLAFGKVARPSYDAYPNDIECEILSGQAVRDRVFSDLFGSQQPVVPLMAYVPVSGRRGTTLTLRCLIPSAYPDPSTTIIHVTWVRLTALRVGTVTIQSI